ncbi:hypothetical protein [Kutzneria sp. 744]|uniref:hypothetical protein n=1 Tax=Kutzneria sp. (strain 744) TaxID=345341 RepID=UPI0007C5036F|nr:hypothetical protein [Kutzneria sp. 744]
MALMTLRDGVHRGRTSPSGFTVGEPVASPVHVCIGFPVVVTWADAMVIFVKQVVQVRLLPWPEHAQALLVTLHTCNAAAS